ncbi:hypothetical protein Aperf_G00000062679 [Anoplocephala perfoliata]
MVNRIGRVLRSKDSAHPLAYSLVRPPNPSFKCSLARTNESPKVSRHSEYFKTFTSCLITVVPPTLSPATTTIMVSGARSRVFYSRSKPVVSQYGERPLGRGTREKGRGWERSKSSISDYGSDYYSFEEESPLREPRWRRASVEALRKSNKPVSRITHANEWPASNVQKRFITAKGNADRDIPTPNGADIGYADDNRNFLKPMTYDREGPKALPVSGKSNVRNYRSVEMPVITDDFKTTDTSAWEVVGSWSGNPDDDENLNEMRIELRSREVQPGGTVEGRIFFDLKKSTTISNLEVIPKNTLSMSQLNGVSKTIVKKKPFEIKWDEDIPKSVTLPEGANVIPFTIRVLPDLSPSYTYISKDWSKTVNNVYFVEAKARVGRDPKATAGAAVKVLAVGGEKNKYDMNKNENLVVSNKCVTSRDSFNFSYFYNKGQKPGKFKIVCRAKSSRFGLDEVKEEKLKTSKKGKRSDNPVLKNAPSDIKDRIENAGWNTWRYGKNIKINFTTPTVTKGDFTCEYFLRAEETKDEIPLTKVDAYKK